MRKTDNTRKRYRFTSLLSSMTERQEAALLSWFLNDEDFTYKAAVKRLRSMFDIETNIRALHKWWQHYVAPVIEERDGIQGRVRKVHRFPTALDPLSDIQRATLAKWLSRPGVSYAEAKRRCLNQFGLKIAVSTLCSFFQRECAETFEKNVPPRQEPLNIIIQRGNRVLSKITIPPHPGKL